MKHFATRLAVMLTISSMLVACGNTDNSSAGSGKATTAKYKITAENLASHIEILSSDAFGGRAPATEGEELTVDYLTKAFMNAGLKPANGDSFSQSVPLVSIETKNSPVLTIANSTDTVDLGFRSDMVVWTRKEQAETVLTESEMIFVGYGINAPERNWNDYADVDVKGKTVVMLINDPGYATQDPALFNGNAMTYYGRWNYKFDEAAKQGAAAAIIIHTTKPAAYPWATVESSWTGPQFDAVRTNKGADLATLEGWISTEAADQLFDLAGMDRAELARAAQTPGFQAVPLNTRMNTTFKSEINHVTTRNVAGIVEGSERPDEYFIYMAHWDHLGTDPTIDGDGIYNGAFDNASGTAGLVELARMFASGTPPKRSVLFLAVTAEEQGLLGSAYYSANPLVPLSQTVGGINMDGLNNVGPTSDITVVGIGNSELDDYLSTAAAEAGRTLTADPEPEKGYFYRSDHFELSKYGVPMLYPEMGYSHIQHGRDYMDAARANYTANDYHAPSDEYHPNWDLTGAVGDLYLFGATGSLIINSDVWPNWSEGSEFKAARDAQRANK